jgi:hypothetical protein
MYQFTSLRSEISLFRHHQQMPIDTATTGMTVDQFLRDNSALYGILQSVLNVGIGIQLFRTPMNIQGHSDGIRMYINVVKRLGPTVRTQKWIYEQAISERYHHGTKGGIRGFVLDISRPTESWSTWGSNMTRNTAPTTY